ncbi:MAG: VWA domain-containing protein [Pseudomonadota bacterium]
MMANVHFLRPYVLLLLVPALLAVWMLYRRKMLNAGLWASVIDPALQPYVLVGNESTSQARWPWLVAATAVILAIISLAGPALNQSSVPAARSGDAMVIALDLSRSMDATDIAPSRLARAKLKLQDILNARQGGETALLVYSANAFVVTPLTEDIDTIALLIPTLTTDLMPSRGSYPESGIEKAMQLFEQAAVEQGRIVLVTDGGNMPPALRAAREAQAAGHEVSVLAVGTPEGGPIPQRRGGFVTDDRGNMAVPVLNEAALSRLATAGGGAFSVLTNDDADIRRLAVASQDAGRAMTAIEGADVKRWEDLGVFLLLPVMLLASLMFRRGSFAYLALILVFVIPSPNVHAFSWDDLWRTGDQQAAAKLEAGEAAAAAEQFDRSDWQAVANYRAGNFSESAAQFSGLSGADAFYNTGNALARQGEFQPAIEAYEAALQLDPAHEDAAFNLELLRSLQNEQQTSGSDGEPNSDGEEGESENNTGDQNEQSGDGQGDNSESGQTGESPPSSEQQASDEGAKDEQQDIEALQQQFSEAEANGQPERREQLAALTPEERARQEQEQALEQWLRRVPDDPGGLLRRKFRSQYQRRQLDQDGNRLWPDDRTEPW